MKNKKSKIIAIFFQFAIFSLIFSGRLAAQVATEGATNLRDSVKQRVAQELDQIKQSVSKKAFLGTITTKSEASITLSTYRNQTRNLIVSTDTVIKLLNGRDGTLADLKIGDPILAMGDADGKNTLTVKRLLVVAKPPIDNRAVRFGTVSKKTASSFTLTTTSSETVEIRLTSTTKYTGTTKAADIKDSTKVLVLSQGTNNTALKIHLFTTE